MTTPTPEQVAEHWGFGWHLWHLPLQDWETGIIQTHEGWRSEERSATEEECDMWRILERMTPAPAPEKEGE